MVGMVLLIWGNVLGPASSRAFADTLAAIEHSQDRAGQVIYEYKGVITHLLAVGKKADLD
eukprot:1154088-Pelagomonas_calceolata.AAC.2